MNARTLLLWSLLLVTGCAARDECKRPAYCGKMQAVDLDCAWRSCQINGAALLGSRIRVSPGDRIAISVNDLSSIFGDGYDVVIESSAGSSEAPVVLDVEIDGVPSDVVGAYSPRANYYRWRAPPSEPKQLSFRYAGAVTISIRVFMHVVACYCVEPA